MYLSAKTVRKVTDECYGKKLTKTAATKISKRMAKAVEDLELVLRESRGEVGDPAFFFSPELGA
jgi:hypothetical protein